ncbi:MAG: arginine--tRNA ligase [Vicinamibacterales bacterium]
MILPVHETLRERLTEAISERFGIDKSEMPPVVVSDTPSRALGDLAVPIAFELARRLRRPPRAIAEELASALGQVPGIAKVAPVAGGYLNFFLDRPAFLLDRLVGRVEPPAAVGSVKTIVEHTAINPNKAAHIGHLRNAALGDTLVRLLRFRRVPVEVQNYIDDTGVQVADVVVGFQRLEGRDLESVKTVAETTRFDYYCWDLYARVTEWYEQDRARLEARAAALHEIESGGNQTAAIARFVADRIVRCHLETMSRMDVGYDLLTWEGDILRLHFWTRAFEILKERGAVFLQDRGRLAGCWVMQIDDEGQGAGGEADRQRDSAGRREADAVIGDAVSPATDIEAEEREKVIVRSNGTVTYVGKDIAYQFWKFGLLGRDFHYRPFLKDAGGHIVWATSPEPQPGGDLEHPAFGAAGTVYNVIDVRQSYLQKLLKQALVAIGRPEEASRSTHFSYEMVALSHSTARQMGYEIGAEEAARPFVEVSGRKGLGVKADDLLDALVEKAESEVGRRNPAFGDAERRRVAEMIAAAAVRYFMVRFSRGKVIVFDIDEALNFEGESGPYLQYAVVRAGNIFNKLREREGQTEAGFLEGLSEVPAAELDGVNGSDDLWALVLEASRLDEVVDQAVRTLEMSVLAKYAFGLAQMFNGFYHRYPILNEERIDARRWRAAGVSYFRAQLARALDLMGIGVPPRM